ncbi:MAG: hypothetical protein AAGE89_01720 [Pseudomonadota bacterium]
MKKVFKYLAYTIGFLVLLVVGIGIYGAMQPEKPFVTSTSNGVTLEVYGRDNFTNLSTSTVDGRSHIKVDDHEIIYGGGTLMINGEERNIAGATKIHVHIEKDGIRVETES